MAETVNQTIADALLEQQLRDARVERELREEVWAMLLLLESEILSALKSDDPTEFALLARRRREVATLMNEQLDPLIQARYVRLAALLGSAMLRLAQHEAAVVQDVVNAASGEDTLAELPSERQVRAGVVQGLFPSPAKPTDLATTGREWWKRQGDSVSQRLGDSLTVGVALAESLTALTQRVRGTSEQGFQDGLMAKARHDAARLVRTQTTNAISEARVAVADRNARTVRGVQHSSVLDSHTCLAAETLVRTPAGSCPMSEIKVGDSIFGGSGQLRGVLATHITQTMQLARVTLSDGTIIVCTPDHQFLTTDLQWVEAQKLQQNTRLRTETMLE